MKISLEYKNAKAVKNARAEIDALYPEQLERFDIIMNWIKDYNPSRASNDCCFRCTKSAHNGCRWDRIQKLDKGVLAVTVLDGWGNDSKKIIYCPLFEREPYYDSHNYEEKEA